MLCGTHVLLLKKNKYETNKNDIIRAAEEMLFSRKEAGCIEWESLFVH